jgi:hypothetical protein
VGGWKAEELTGEMAKVPPGRIAPACCLYLRQRTILPL